jgi:hypothetical protein
MKTIAMGMIVVTVVLLSGGTHVQTKPSSPTGVFVGTMPCGEAVRAFVGGESCQSVIWRLDLGVTSAMARVESHSSVWRQFGIECRHDARWTTPLRETGKIRDDVSPDLHYGKSISFRQVSSTLIHLLDEQNRLMPGPADGATRSAERM